MQSSPKPQPKSQPKSERSLSLPQIDLYDTNEFYSSRAEPEEDRYCGRRESEIYEMPPKEVMELLLKTSKQQVREVSNMFTKPTFNDDGENYLNYPELEDPVFNYNKMTKKMEKKYNGSTVDAPVWDDTSSKIHCKWVGFEQRLPNQDCTNFVRFIIVLKKCIKAKYEKSATKIIHMQQLITEFNNIYSKDLFEEMDHRIIDALINSLEIGKIPSDCNTYKVLESYETWSGKFHEKYASQGMSMPEMAKFLLFIKKLIQFINLNNDIINKEDKHSNAEDGEIKKFLESLERNTANVYVTVNYDRIDEKYTNASAIATPFRIANTFTQSFMPENSLPMMYGSGNNNNIMRGGYGEDGEDSTNNYRPASTEYRTMFEDIKSKLQDNNLTLEANDEKNINNTLNMLEMFERRIIKLSVIFTNFNKIVKIYKKHGLGPSITPRQISISNILSKKDLIDCLYNQLEEIRTCIENNLYSKEELSAKVTKHMSSLFTIAQQSSD